jgi:hypothetical protein
MSDAAAAASPRILISYRRDDSSGYAGRLFDRLTTALGPQAVFLDIDGIASGADFVDAIQKAVASSHVLIAVIGRNWLDIRDDAGKRRLDDPGDFVRLEITTALQRGILVIPALVQDARMPREQDLPRDLNALARKQAIEISDTRFNEDVERLLDDIRASGALPGYDAAPGGGPDVAEGRRFGRRAAMVMAVVLAAGSLVWGGVTWSRRTGKPDDPATAPPVVRRFTVEPSRYFKGHVSTVTLSWEVGGAAEISLPPLGSVEATGSRTVPAPTEDSTYALRASNRLGDTGGRAVVDVMTLDEFIAIDVPSPETHESFMKWLSNYLRSLEAIGFLPELRGVVISVQPGLANAYFDPQSRRIVIGQTLLGDQDVVLREYTHLMLMGPEFKREGGIDPTRTPEGNAIESGLADYLPASALGDPRIGEVAGPILLQRPFVRILINNRRFPDIRPNDPPQVAGETWGGAFWEMRLALGRATLDPLLLAAWKGVGAGGATGVGRRFVDTLIDGASGRRPGEAEKIRRVLRDRQFPF